MKELRKYTDFWLIIETEKEKWDKDDIIHTTNIPFETVKEINRNYGQQGGYEYLITVKDNRNQYKNIEVFGKVLAVQDGARPNLDVPTFLVESKVELLKHTEARSTFQGTPCFAQERLAHDVGFRSAYIMREKSHPFDLEDMIKFGKIMAEYSAKFDNGISESDYQMNLETYIYKRTRSKFELEYEINLDKKLVDKKGELIKIYV